MERPAIVPRRQGFRDPFQVTITPAPKKLIRTRLASEGSASEPCWRVGLVCASIRNFLAGVILVLTLDEVDLVLSEMDCTALLVCSLLYGSGPQLRMKQH